MIRVDYAMTSFPRIAAVLASRFILDLRLAFHKPDTTNRVSTVRFASSFIGNMGAPLGTEDSTWVSGAADDVVNEHVNHQEEVDEPFLFGLEPHRPSDYEAQARHGSLVYVPPATFPHNLLAMLTAVIDNPQRQISMMVSPLHNLCPRSCQTMRLPTQIATRSTELDFTFRH